MPETTSMEERSALDISKTISFMDQEQFGGQMEIGVKRIGFTTRWKAKEFTLGKTELNHG